MLLAQCFLLLIYEESNKKAKVFFENVSVAKYLGSLELYSDFAFSSHVFNLLAGV